jgi:hypothetical protein
LALRGVGCLQAKRGTFAAPIGEAGRIRSTNKKFLQIFFFIHCASPIGGVRIVGPIVLAQHKRNKRIGKAWKTVRSALPIVIESPISIAVLTGNGNMFNTSWWRIKT